jgi:hypothetical protein
MRRVLYRAAIVFATVAATSAFGMAVALATRGRTQPH